MEWHRFDYDNKAETAPPADRPVWIVEEFYLGGVGIGYFDGVTMRIWRGSGDCFVWWWAPMEIPAPPAEWSPYVPSGED